MINPIALSNQQLTALTVVQPHNTAALLHNATVHCLRVVQRTPLLLSVHHSFSVHPDTVQSSQWNEGWFNNYE